MKPKYPPVLYRGNPDVFGPTYAARLRAGEIVYVAGFVLELDREWIEVPPQIRQETKQGDFFGWTT